MARVRLVLLGAGFFARKWLEAVTARADCEVVGIASRSRTRAEELQRDFGLAGAILYSSWEEAIDQGKADAIIITLPQTLHPEATKLAKLRVLSVAPLLGEAIRRTHEEASISSLFI